MCVLSVDEFEIELMYLVKEDWMEMDCKQCETVLHDYERIIGICDTCTYKNDVLI